MTDAYDVLRRDWCDAGDMPRATCAHCLGNTTPIIALIPDRPWSFDGQHVTRRGLGRSGRDIFPSAPFADRPSKELPVVDLEKTSKPTCRYDDECGWVGAEHLRDCVDRECAGCKPCGKDHCGLSGCAQHVEHDAGIWTCPRCIGRARGDLAAIVDLYALVPTAADKRGNELGPLLEEAADAGLESEAFNLVGPAAAPEQYSEKRNRLRALYERRGWCDWPRHEGFHEDDPHHPYAVLGRWDMAMRESYGPQTDLFVTISSAAAYLTGLLAAGFPHTQEFEDFTREIRTCRQHLEQVVHDDSMPEKGAPCPTCAAERGKGAPKLQKRYAVHPGLPAGMRCGAKDLSQGRLLECKICDGDNDTWHCPAVAEHWWTDADYRLRVDGDYVEHATDLPAAELAERLGVPVSTIRKWAARVWIKKTKTWREPLLVSRRTGVDGRKLYPVARALELAERRGA